jgi:serine/threonine protein kinase
MRTVSHYELIEKLGEGGMGVVWKARDTRLDRLVAIKFLPPDKTSDPERKRRFAQEARAASALNHPRIVTIHDIDHADGADFIVMEFLGGKTLEQLIPPKGMKVIDALRYAIQIADALAAAHAAGIVHRDLKPANVIVSDAGQVKVLDFGLAKLQEDTSTSEVDYTRTIAQDVKTEAGTIVGTTSYMSPEQAEGKKVDARSDIFSFGSVLYEMLTGKRAFRGDSKMSTLAAILRADPDSLEKQVDGVPRDLVRIVQRCLRKDPDERAQSMADLRIALKEIKEESESGLLAVPSAAPRKKAGKGLRLAAGFAVIVLGAGAAYMWRAKSAPDPTLVATLLTSYPGLEQQPSFSPDGNQVAFSWSGDHDDNYDIYVKLLAPGKPLRLTTDPAADRSPTWSPDGRSIAFVRKNSIFVVPPIGGTEREVLPAFVAVSSQAITSRELTWSPDSRWLVASNREKPGDSSSIYLVAADTGEKRRLTTAPKGINGDYFGAISPDGKSLAFSRIMVAGSAMMTQSDLYILPLGNEYTPKGEARRVTSESVYAQGLTWTSDSRELVFTWYKGGAPALWRLPADGSGNPVKLAVGEHGFNPTISHSGQRLAFEYNLPSDLNIWGINLVNPAEPPVSIINSTRPEQSAQFSPDGKKIVFQSERSGPASIWMCDADGGNAQQMTKFNASGSPSWSPDGQRIAFDNVADGHWQIFTMSARGGKPEQLTSGPVAHSRPSWSHDGKWIFASGGAGIFKIPVAGGTPVQLSAGGGTNPAESFDGQTVYYQKENTIWRVGVDGSGDRAAIDGPSTMQGIAVARDGIYYTTGSPNRGIQFFEFSTGRSRVVRKLEKSASLGISVSADGRSLIYCQVDTRGSGDLMLVDPFR